MTTGRRPTIPPSDLADTLDESDSRCPFGRTPAMDDELREPHRVTQGSRSLPHRDTGPFRREPSGVRDPFFDAGPADPDAPVNVDLHDRISALEAHRQADAAQRATDATRAATADKWMTRGGKALSVLAASALAALTYAFALARSDGDAAATTRERETQRLDVYGIVRRLDREAGAVAERLGSVERALARFPIGFVPLQGPMSQPKEPPP